MRFQYHVKSNQMFQFFNISMELPSHAADWGIIGMGLSIFLSKYYSIVVKRRILIHPVRFRNSKIKKILILDQKLSKYLVNMQITVDSQCWWVFQVDQAAAGSSRHQIINQLVLVSWRWTSSWLQYNRDNEWNGICKWLLYINAITGW